MAFSGRGIAEYSDTGDDALDLKNTGRKSAYCIFSFPVAVANYLKRGTL